MKTKINVDGKFKPNTTDLAKKVKQIGVRNRQSRKIPRTLEERAAEFDMGGLIAPTK